MVPGFFDSIEMLATLSILESQFHRSVRLRKVPAGTKRFSANGVVCGRIKVAMRRDAPNQYINRNRHFSKLKGIVVAFTPANIVFAHIRVFTRKWMISMDRLWHALCSITALELPLSRLTRLRKSTQTTSRILEPTESQYRICGLPRVAFLTACRTWPMKTE